MKSAHQETYYTTTAQHHKNALNLSDIEVGYIYAIMNELDVYNNEVY